jgi:HEAT repeat protein
MITKLLTAVATASLYVVVVSAQMSFEQTVRELSSAEPETRLRAVRLLKEAAYLEAALPLARLLTDPEDEIQYEAIGAELNIFLAEKIVPKRRVALIVEVRNKIVAEAAFNAGPSALGPNPVPSEVLAALVAAIRDDNPAIALESLYAFGTLAVEPAGTAHRDVRRTSALELAPMLGAPDPALRLAAVRVIGRVFASRPPDAQADVTLGDAVIVALNDNDRNVRTAAMDALGGMRYERAVQALTELHQYYGRGTLAEAALDALARIGHRASAPLMTAALTGRTPALKRIAVEGLARMGDAAFLAAIQTAVAGERSEPLLLATAFAAARLSNGTLDEIVNATARTERRAQALGYLIELAPGRSSAFARQALDPDASIRADVADVLGMSGDAAALPIVEPMMRDADPTVARAATRAVARLRAATRATS